MYTTDLWKDVVLKPLLSGWVNLVGEDFDVHWKGETPTENTLPVNAEKPVKFWAIWIEHWIDSAQLSMINSPKFSQQRFGIIKYLTLGSRSNPVRPKPNLSSSSSFPFCSLRLSEDPVISHRRRHCRWVRLHLQMSKTMSRPSWSSVVAWIIRRMNTCKQEIDTNWTMDTKLKHILSL